MRSIHCLGSLSLVLILCLCCHYVARIWAAPLVAPLAIFASVISLILVEIALTLLAQCECREMNLMMHVCYLYGLCASWPAVPIHLINVLALPCAHMQGQNHRRCRQSSAGLCQRSTRSWSGC